MKKLMGILVLVSLVMIIGCSASAGASLWQIGVSGEAQAHDWQQPSFAADLESNPVSSKLVAGFVTFSSEAGVKENANWASLDFAVAPK